MMQSDTLDSGPFTLLPYFPSAHYKPLYRYLLACVESLSGLRTLQCKYDELPPYDDTGGFIECAFDSLGISYGVNEDQITNIPSEGPVVVVANHPYGGVDGMILAHLLGQIRNDVRILANYHLKRIPELSDLFIAVDPFGGQEAHSRNMKPLRDSLRWLDSGGLLVIFPAGEVSHYQFRQQQIADPQWADSVGRIVRRAQAPVVPIRFHGGNSMIFNLAGMLHPRLRTLMLPRELISKSRRDIRLTIGKPLSYRKLSCLESPRELTDYLRLRCYLLESGEPAKPGKSKDAKPVADKAPESIAGPVSRRLLCNEINDLGLDNLLHRTDEFDVLMAKPEQVPWALQEIGRLREKTFRAAGEGTGKPVDIDLFDTWYDQLFLWHRQRQEIAGAYRLGPVQEIMARRGKKGLYTRSLFKYRKSFLTNLGPSLELGRSFVCEDYQRSFQALNLLWKGIGLYASRKDLAVLFGPVSISQDYSTSSRMVLVHSFNGGEFSSPLSRKVQPRRPVRTTGRINANHKELRTLRDIDLVSDLVSQLEADGKGIPVLMRQYLKMGGRFLSFSQDPDFSDVVDGLVLVDLRRCDERVLTRFMGKETAREYLRRMRVSDQV